MKRSAVRKSLQPTSASSDEARIERIMAGGWISYTRAREALSQLEWLLAHPKIQRMPNLLLVGETNNGKTAIAMRFLALHPASDNADGLSIVVPALLVQSPPAADERILFTGILEELCPTLRRPAPRAELQFQVLRVLRSIDVGMLIVDEFQHALTGSYNQRRRYLNAIKILGNELQIPIVAIGTDEAFNALNADSQLSNRFEPFVLPLWSMENKDYFRLLASFEQALALKKPSLLTEVSLASRILAMSEGTIGEIAEILKRAATWAIRSGAECIDFKALERISYTPPSQRKKHWGGYKARVHG